MTLACYHEAPVRHPTSHPSDSSPSQTSPGGLESITQDLRVQARRDRFARAWYGITRDTLSVMFGQPLTILARPTTPIPVGRFRDSLITFSYDSGTFIFFKQGGGHEEQLIQANVWAPRFMRTADIHLGMSAVDVRAFFGDSARDSTPLVLSTPIDSVIGGAELTFKGDRLVRVMWTYGDD